MSSVDKKVLKKKVISGKRKLSETEATKEVAEVEPKVTEKSSKKVKKESTDEADTAPKTIEVSTSEDSVLYDFDPNGTNIDFSFDSLDVHPNTRKAIVAMGFTRMTEVQARTIPVLLVRYFIVFASPTHFSLYIFIFSWESLCWLW